MLGYVTVGTSDFDKARGFYDALIAEVGGHRVFESPTGQFYGFKEGTLFGVLKPHNGQAATGGNGTMFAFKVSSPADVDRIYEAAILLGAKDDGRPGPRGERGFYGSYFRDSDGNKICIYHM
jgi:catechol 2,3-dioxygenase-like lactoylglutathione lyase family enzyme